MNSLCISTSQLECGVLVSIDDRNQYEVFNAQQTGELIQLIVHRLVHNQPIQQVIVDTGPGSYTGTRIGVAFAQGYARGLGLEWVGIRAWDILNILKPHHSTSVIAVKSGEVFALFSDQSIRSLPLSEIQNPFGYPCMNPQKYGGTTIEQRSYPQMMDWLLAMRTLAERGLGTQKLPEYYDQFSSSRL
ncbi:MAG: hypothetical protein N2450_06160 [bacterium]|nr:hypothetical protein [bacterium]